jgi:hypothetical protein
LGNFLPDIRLVADTSRLSNEMPRLLTRAGGKLEDAEKLASRLTPGNRSDKDCLGAALDLLGSGGGSGRSSEAAPAPVDAGVAVDARGSGIEPEDGVKAAAAGF